MSSTVYWCILGALSQLLKNEIILNKTGESVRFWKYGKRFVSNYELNVGQNETNYSFLFSSVYVS